MFSLLDLQLRYVENCRKFNKKAFLERKAAVWIRNKGGKTY